MTTLSVAQPLPYLLMRPDLLDVLGLSRGTVADYVARQLIPAPTHTCRSGPLWQLSELTEARRYPNKRLAAVVPIDEELGEPELRNNVYVCPAESAYHAGWASPSILGLVQRGGRVTWRMVDTIARYRAGENDPFESGSAPNVDTRAHDRNIADRANPARVRRMKSDGAVTVFTLGTQMGNGTIAVAKGSTAGLQRVRFLRRNGHWVGAEDNMLELAQLDNHPTFVLPTLDEAFPKAQ